MEWTNTDWPDWQDDGRNVEVELADGRIVQGVLFVADVAPFGDDEVPMFAIRSHDGREHDFASNERWRFL